MKAIAAFLIAMAWADPTTVFVHGTEFCGVARDTTAFLESEGSGPHLSYLGESCHVAPGDLPRKGADSGLSDAAGACAQAVGAERWQEFTTRWTRAFRTDRADVPDPARDPLVGAFCNAVRATPRGEAIVFENFAHGLATGSRLGQKTGHFQVADLPENYPGSALWALQSLAPAGTRVVSLHENCYSQALLNDMLFGPDHDFASYRPGSCGVAAAPHDHLLALETERDTRYVPIPGDTDCLASRTEKNPRYTFASNMRQLPHPRDVSIRAYEDTYRAQPGPGSETKGESNYPVSSSSDLLELYADGQADAMVSFNHCVLRGEPITGLAVTASVALRGEAERLMRELRALYRAEFGQAPARSLNMGAVQRRTDELERENPPSRVVAAYRRYNDAAAALDHVTDEIARLCGPALAPRCEPPENSCPAAAQKIAERDRDRATLNELSAAYQREQGHLVKLQAITRLALGLGSLERMVDDLGSGDASRHARASGALAAYLDIVQCEQRGIFR